MLRTIPTRLPTRPLLRLAAATPAAARAICLAPPALPRSRALFTAFLSRPVSRRTYSSTSTYSISKLSDREYHNLSDGTLDSLLETFEILLEESPSASDWDIEFASGVLNLRLGSHGTYVINKQPPNKQIWLSSPSSGPKRFDYDRDNAQWFSTKEGQTVTLKELLNNELTTIFQTDVKVLQDLDD